MQQSRECIKEEWLDGCVPPTSTFSFLLFVVVTPAPTGGAPPVVDFLSIRLTSFPPSDLLSAALSLSLLLAPPLPSPALPSVHSAAPTASQTHSGTHTPTHTHARPHTDDSRAVNISRRTSSCPQLSSAADHFSVCVPGMGGF